MSLPANIQAQATHPCSNNALWKAAREYSPQAARAFCSAPANSQVCRINCSLVMHPNVCTVCGNSSSSWVPGSFAIVASNAEASLGFPLPPPKAWISLTLMLFALKETGYLEKWDSWTHEQIWSWWYFLCFQEISSACAQTARFPPSKREKSHFFPEEERKKIF